MKLADEMRYKTNDAIISQIDLTIYDDIIRNIKMRAGWGDNVLIYTLPNCVHNLPAYEKALQKEGFEISGGSLSINQQLYLKIRW